MMRLIEVDEIERSVVDVVNAFSGMLRAKERLVVGIAGPPASGKSMLAGHIVDYLNRQAANSATLLPMDGFHLDNVLLEKAGLLSRKGSPQTFDFRGFQIMLSLAKDRSLPIYYPTFDRSRDIAIAGSAVIEPQTEVVVVEGNYLLLDNDPWRGLSQSFDHTVFVETPLETLRKRLVQRWLDHGYSAQDAQARVSRNDLPNALLVLENRMAADQIIRDRS